MTQPLLLPSAHTAVLVPSKTAGLFEKYQHAFFVFGLLAVLLGGLDLVRHLPSASGDNAMLKAAFAPAILLEQ